MLIGLGKVRLRLGEAGLAAAVAHRLVLQRALAALVADRAVERVVDEQELHHALLRLVGDRRGELGVDDHAVGDGDRAGRLRLGHRRGRCRRRGPRPGTGGRRRPGRAAGGRRSAGSGCRSARRRGSPGCPWARVTSTPSMVSVTSSDFSGAVCRRLLGCGRHALAPAGREDRGRRRGRTGSRRASRCARYSSRKYWIDEVIGLVAPSPSAQNDRPRMLSHRSSSSVEVGLGALALLERWQHLHQPPGALAARRALAAGLVLVELGPAQHRADHAGGLVEDLQRAGAEHRAGRADALVVERHVEVLGGQQRRATSRRASRTSARGPRGCRRRGRAARAA